MEITLNIFVVYYEADYNIRDERVNLIEEGRMYQN